MASDLFDSAPDVLLPVRSAPRPARSTSLDTEQDDQVVVVLCSAAHDLARRRSIRDLEETLRQIVASAVDAIAGVDAGSISIIEQDWIETRHPNIETNAATVEETFQTAKSDVGLDWSGWSRRSPRRRDTARRDLAPQPPARPAGRFVRRG